MPIRIVIYLLLLLIPDIGVWTVALARHRGGKAQVHAFEAVRETYYYLGANVVLNELHNVVTHYGAVADRPGVVDVAGYDVSDTTTVTNIAGFSIPHSRRIKEISNGTALMRSTPVLTLDGLFESGQIASCPTFMKLVRYLISTTPWKCMLR